MTIAETELLIFRLVFNEMSLEVVSRKREAINLTRLKNMTLIFIFSIMGVQFSYPLTCCPYEGAFEVWCESSARVLVDKNLPKKCMMQPK